MKLFKTAILLLFFVSKLSAQNFDSLRNRLAEQRGNDRLPTLLQLCPYEFKGLISAETARKYAQEIFQLAVPRRDSAAIVKACLCTVVNQDNTADAENTPQYLRQAEDLAAHFPNLLMEVQLRWGSYYNEIEKEDSSEISTRKGLFLAEKYGYISRKATFLSILARYESSRGQREAADSLINLALRLCRNRLDSAEVLWRKGGIMKDLGRPEAAAACFLETYQLGLRIPNLLLATVSLNQYANILRDEGKNQQAIRYFEEAIHLAKQINYDTRLASVYNSLGVLYEQEKDYDQALKYYNLALRLKKNLGRPKKIITTVRNLAALYLKMEKYAACDTLCRNYLPMSDSLKNPELHSGLCFIAAIAAAKIGKKTEAKYWAVMGDKSAEQLKIREEIPENYRLGAQTHALLGNFEKAYFYQNQFQNIRDSISDAQKSRTIAELETRYETQKKEQQIAVLAKDNELRRTQQYALFGGVAGLSVLAFILGRAIRNRKRHNLVLSEKNTQLTTKNKEIETLLREIHHRVKNNLQIISSLLSLQARHVRDENALEALQTGQARVRSMALLHQRLYQGEQRKEIPMRPYLTDLSQSLFDVYLDDDDRLTLTTQFDELGLDIDTAVPLGLIANELITNALKYAFPDGRAGKIELRLVKEATCFRLFVADNGIGIPLSTEGKPVKKRSSFGLELVDSLVEKLNGQLIFTNQNGTKTELIVPFATQKPVIAA